MRRLCRWLLVGTVMLGVPAMGWAYVVCTEVINVYPNGRETHCKDCNIYSNATGEWQGEITNCLDGPGGPV